MTGQRNKRHRGVNQNQRRGKKERDRLKGKAWSERRPPYAQPDLNLSFTVHVCGGQVPDS